MSEREYSERPWGNYTVLDDDAPDHKVKRIVVHPGKRLSYQRHSQRAEHWFIVSGTATVTLDGTVTELHPGESIDIPLEGAHRIANEGDDRRRLHRGAARHVFRRGRHRPARGRLRARRRARTRRDADRRSPGGRTDLFLRVLPAQERQGTGHAGPHHRRAAAPGALVRLGHLPRRGRVTAAHFRPGVGHVAHDQAQPDGPPHLCGPHPPGAGRHLGVAAQGRRREPDGPRRRSARGPRRPARASWPTPPSWSSWPAPSAASPSAWPRTRPAIPARRTCERPRLSWPPSSRWPTSA